MYRISGIQACLWGMASTDSYIVSTTIRQHIMDYYPHRSQLRFTQDRWGNSTHGTLMHSMWIQLSSTPRNTYSPSEPVDVLTTLVTFLFSFSVLVWAPKPMNSACSYNDNSGSKQDVRSSSPQCSSFPWPEMRGQITVLCLIYGRR